LANYTAQTVPIATFDLKIDTAKMRVNRGKTRVNTQNIITIYLENGSCDQRLKSIMEAYLDGRLNKSLTLHNLESLRYMNGNNGHDGNNGHKTKDDDDVSEPCVYVL